MKAHTFSYKINRPGDEKDSMRTVVSNTVVTFPGDPTQGVGTA